jgi:DNA polymerase-3 subunit gamma/tau
MTYQVLARKWRPKGFDQLVGQSHVVTALVNALKSQRLHHAYLFTGTRGVGKTTLARILAKSINCETGITSTPCGKCRACTDIDAGRFIDLLEVDAATNTKVDEMRELLDTSQYMPVSGRFKVYIIDEVHMLSRHAFNSMLKTLEEPPEHVKFILATTDPQRLPVTVLSRCLQFNLKPLSPAMIAGHLKHVLEAEQIPFELPALDSLGRAAQGSVRDSLSLLDQAIAFGSGTVTQAQVSEMLGALGTDLLLPVIERIAEGDATGTLAEADRLAERSLSFDAALQDIASLLHRIAIIQACGAQPDDDARMAGLAGKLGAEQVQVCYQIALLARRDLALAPDEFSGFTMALLRMLSFTSTQPGALQAVAGGEARTPAQRAARPATAAMDAQPAQAAIPPPASQPFDGDWPSFVARLGLTGMAGMVAKHGEFVSLRSNHLELSVPESKKMYAEKAYQEKLKGELAPHLGDNLRVTIRVGAGEGRSLAAVEDEERSRQMARATAAISGDPFVNELVSGLGAEVVQASIRPAGESK